MKHLLSLEKLSRAEIELMVRTAAVFKRERGHHPRQPLAGQTWALLFAKSSTRTRVSFEVGIRELGGQVIFLSASEIQLGRGEPIKDTARVLGRMVHGAVIRTYAQRDVEEFAEYSGIPTINALTDEEHPCQILADLFTFQEKRGSIQGKVVTFVGDGACNVPASWIFAAAKLGFELRIAAPKQFQPPLELLKRISLSSVSTDNYSNDIVVTANVPDSDGKVVLTSDCNRAARDADLLYTDVWVSMGKEAEAAERIKALGGYQVNQALVKRAKPDALVMHCLPAYRGKEIDDETFEAHAQTIFDEAENRLHVQKAILDWVVS
ncbi:MAG TPA: ornithine carbamoyltransferase [Candidatus Eisenbacteria bacterium]|jgi:ornithine carbamoyltransferase|nr:ornithine carbamoyltransferase [Candidatus Eisenbacteria bacterium]